MADYDEVSDAEADQVAMELAGDAEEDVSDSLLEEGDRIASALHGEALASWNLRKIRTVLGISQQQIADRLAEGSGPVKLSQSQIAKIERGERPWRVNEMLAISDALGIDFPELLRIDNVLNDPDMVLLGARLNYDRAWSAEQRVREAWREAAKATRRAGETFVRTAAELGVRDEDAMRVIWSWSHHREYLVKIGDVDPKDFPAKEEVTKAHQETVEWVEDQWRRFQNEYGKAGSDHEPPPSNEPTEE